MQDDLGSTPLMAAIQKGDTHIVEVLVEHGANVNYQNKVRLSITLIDSYSCQTDSTCVITLSLYRVDWSEQLVYFPLRVTLTSTG